MCLFRPSTIFKVPGSFGFSIHPSGQYSGSLSVVMFIYLFIVLIGIRFTSQSAHGGHFIIGVITDPKDSLVRKSFNSAITSLKSTGLNSGEIKWVETIAENSSELEICGEFDYPPTIVFDLTGKKSSSLSASIKRYSRQTGVPTISINPSSEEWNSLTPNEYNYLLTVRTPSDVIPSLILDIVELHNLSQVIILHDTSFVVDKNLELMLEGLGADYRVETLAADSLEATLTRMKVSGTNNYFVLAKIVNINRILEKAAGLGMFKFQDSWFIVTKGRGQMKCANCSHGSVLFYQPSRVKSVEYDHAPGLFNVSNERRLDAFFVYDLARFAFESVNNLVQSGNWPANLTYPMCGSPLTARQIHERRDLKLREIMASEGFHGLFGQFIISSPSANELTNERIGHSIDYQEIVMRANRIELWNYQPFRYYLISEWIADPPRGRFILTGALQANQKPQYRIVTIKQPPFVMQWPNGTWYGYCIDLLELIQDKLPEEDKFAYELYECPDGKYGDKDPSTGKWDGIMGQLQDKKVEIGIGSVTVMAERESVVDFTVPYYDLVGVSILMKRTATPSHMFKFLTVLTNEVWITVLVCYLITSSVMFVYDRLSPYSYHNAVETSKELGASRDFTLKECLWFCMTSLTPQGGGEAPINPSGRIVAACWWIFGFVLIATYTANLAAFLTVSRLDSPVDGLDKLVEQYRIRYAPVRDSLSMTYFKRMAYIERKFYEIWRNMTLDENMEPKERARLTVWGYPLTQKYSNVWKQIEISKMPATFEEGITRVKSSTEGFALLADATKIRYVAMIDCDLQQVGNEFSRKPIALAVQEGSPLKDKLSSAILKLLNQRQLESLKEKWWNNNPERKVCEDPKKSSDGISIKNIGGVFIVISVGVVLACITLIWEHCIVKRFRKSSAKVASNNFKGHFNRKLTPTYNFQMPFKSKSKEKI